VRLSHKLVVSAIGAFGGGLAIVGILWVRQEMSLIEGSARHDLALMGRSLRPALVGTWNREGRDRAFELLEFATERIQHRARDVEIRWLSLDDLATSMLPLAPREIDQIRGGQEVYRRLEGDEQVYVYVPFHAAGLPDGALELSRSLSREHAAIRDAVANIVVPIAVVLVCLTAVTVLVIDVLLGRPLRQLAAQARRVASGDLGVRVRLGRADELGVVANEMDTMCDRLIEAREKSEAEYTERIAMLQQLRHVDRLSTVGTLAAGIAHELGTPLNVVLGHAKMIETGEQRDGQACDGARVIGEQGAKMIRIIRQLLDFARRPAAARTVTRVVPIVQRSLELVGALAGTRGVTLELVGDPAQDEVCVEPTEIEQVVTNIVTNAIHASPPGAAVRTSIDRRAMPDPDAAGTPPRDYVSVEIRDHGAGIAAADVARVFDPFFTTKPVGEGTGLGLSIAYGIAREHGGWIEVDTELGQGTAFTINLPIATSRGRSKEIEA
jgi:signal transduction histidine kinase